MSNLRQFIEHVLAKRKAQRPKLEAVREGLQELKCHLSHLRRLATDVVQGEDAPPSFRHRVNSLLAAIVQIDNRIDEADARTATLIARFCKDTINIGVAGKARQGKSTVLQAISGLTTREIPSSPGPPVTGAKSRILHSSDDSYAKIEFYQSAEFLREIVHSYYAELSLRNPPASLEEFEREFPDKPDFEKPESHAVFEKLRELHAGIAEYRPYLSQPDKKVGLDEIRDYVSQENQRRRYVAVRCANIFVPFPNGDVTGLALVDLPGLGEIAKGHSEKLVTSLQREIDAIILVKFPVDTGDDWFAADIKVFNEVKQAVPEFVLSDWLFVVLNRKEGGDNDAMVHTLKTRPLHIGSSPRILDVNCRNTEAVQREVFSRVLTHLEQNLDRLDQQQRRVLDDQLTSLSNDVDAAMNPLREYFQKDTIGTDDRHEFNRRFDEFVTKLRAALDELTNEYRKAVRDKSKIGEIAKAVDQACDEAKQSVPVPTANQLQEGHAKYGGWPAVVQLELHYLRSHLTHSLADKLDRSLAELVEAVRREIMARVLKPLNRTLPADVRESSEPQKQLVAFRQLLDPVDQPNLISGIDYLLAFSFSYQSHFHHRVREAMDPLDPMAEREVGEDDPITSIAQAASAKAIEQGLRAYYEMVVYEVRKRLHREMENDPMRAIFSMVEETRDRLARARSIEVEWDDLLYPHRADIWPETFNRFAVASAQRNDWLKSIEAITRLSANLRMTRS